MRRGDALGRRALIYLLVALFAACLPHWDHSPPWLWVLGLVIVFWRYQVHRGLWALPSRLSKVLLCALLSACIFLSYRPVIGLEPMSSLLIAASLLKLCELRVRRDAVLLHYLSYFIVLLQALYDPSLGSAVYIFFGLMLVTASLTALHQGDESTPWFTPLKQGGVFILQALPLALVLFLLMPRLGSLWSVPSPQHAARSGVSDSMSPGDFGKLGRDSALAFRVSFEEGIPPLSQLYWRGLVFSNFDGRRWQGEDEYSSLTALQQSSAKGLAQNVGVRGTAQSYRQVLEATQQPWLYTLPFALSDERGVRRSEDFRLLRRRPISTRTQLDFSFYADYQIEAAGLNERSRLRETTLPKAINPRSLKLAQSWRGAGMDDQAVIEAALARFAQSFRYTLEPPLLGLHSVDEFLFDTQAGFCEHFASSFVVLMRAAGLPARVVVGYQGGEVSADGSYLVVRQYDAHAWAEVWLQGQGWLRVDPTAAVAPERVEQGFSAAILDRAAFDAESTLALGSIPWLSQLRWQWDGLNYQWHRWVLAYGEEQKLRLLQQLLGGVEPWRIFSLFILCLAGVAAALLLGRSGGKEAEELRLYRRWCRKLRAQGIEPAPAETSSAFVQRVIAAQPQQAQKTEAIGKLFAALRYAPVDDARRQQYLRALKQGVRKF